MTILKNLKRKVCLMVIFRVKQQKIMSRYEFNEHPQVTAWRIKCEKLQEEIKELKEAYEFYKENADFYRVRLKEEEKYYEKKLEDFNRLPWWEKMFYRFWF